MIKASIFDILGWRLKDLRDKFGFTPRTVYLSSRDFEVLKNETYMLPPSHDVEIYVGHVKFKELK